MTGATYLATTAVQQLEDAQRILDAHVMLGTGACRLCDTLNSCDYRVAASATFVRYGRLPRRRPGASRPELIGARRLTV